MAGKKPIPAHDVEMGGASGGGVRGSTVRPAPKGGSVGKRSGVKFGKAKKTTAKKLFTDKDVRRTAEKRGMGRFIRDGGNVSSRMTIHRHLKKHEMTAKNMNARQRSNYIKQHKLKGKDWYDWADKGKGAGRNQKRYAADQKAKRVNYVRNKMVDSAKKHGGVTKKGKSKALGFDKHMDQDLSIRDKKVESRANKVEARLASHGSKVARGKRAAEKATRDARGKVQVKQAKDAKAKKVLREAAAKKGYRPGKSHTYNPSGSSDYPDY